MLSKGNVGLLAYSSILSNLETIFSYILLLKEGIESMLLGNSSHPGMVYYCVSSYLLQCNRVVLNLNGWEHSHLSSHGHCGSGFWVRPKWFWLVSLTWLWSKCHLGLQLSQGLTRVGFAHLSSSWQASEAVSKLIPAEDYPTSWHRWETTPIAEPQSFCNQKWHTITSAVFCFLDANKQALPALKGRGWPRGVTPGRWKSSGPSWRRPATAVVWWSGLGVDWRPRVVL